jgi:hypothetical protein
MVYRNKFDNLSLIRCVFSGKEKTAICAHVADSDL